VPYLNSISGLVATDVQDAIDELDYRLDTVEGDDQTEGSIAKSLKDANDYTDDREVAITNAYEAAIDAAKIALGTNFSVADITERDSLTDLTVGDIVFVADNGDTKWAQYKVTEIDPNVFLKIMDQDIMLNALSEANIKTAYENNADTNAFTDALLSKVNAIEENAKDDQDADEVPYDNNTSGLAATDVQDAIDELDYRLDTVEGTGSGSIAEALQDAKDYTDQQVATKDEAEEILYDNTRSGLDSSVTDVQVAIDVLEGRLSTAETDITTLESDITVINGTGAGSIAEALQDAKDYTDDEILIVEGRLDTIEGGPNIGGSVAKAEADAISAAESYTNSKTGPIEDRLDIIQGTPQTGGSIEKAAADTLSDAQDYTDAQIILAKTALGTNFVVDDLTERDALPDLTIGDNVFVNDNGNQRWAQYKVINDDPLEFIKIMDQAILINALDGPGVKVAYESNANTNAFTDALLNKLNLIEDDAKDDQNASEVPYNNATSGFDAINVQAAIDEINHNVFGSANPNLILASPPSEAGTPSFRALVSTDIPNLDADKITSGTLNANRIPDLDSDKITSGTLNISRIPDLDADKITSGTLDAARIPSLSANIITTDIFNVALIPDLSADKITSSTFNLDRIPTLTVDKIPILTTDKIPNLSANKITSDVLDVARIPDLDASKIDTGILDVGRIPDLSADKITTDTLNVDRIPTLAQSKITDLETDLAARVVGPTSAVDTNFAAFDGTTGKLIEDSGFSPSSFAKISIGNTAPTTPSAGDLWFNNDAQVKNLFFYDGTDWIGINTYQ
jgi:hypothetical protein